MQPWTILKLLEWTTEYFKKNEIPNPRLDAELLLSHILKKKRIELYLCFEQIVSETDLATFKGFIQRRIKREPLQYITGVQEFWGIPIKVTPDVLIPRPETEILVETVLKKIPEDKKQTELNILDLCTGSGAIVAALASELPNAKLIGIDISEAALGIAKENTDEWKERVELIHSDLFDSPPFKGELEGVATLPIPPLKGREQKFDLIISNPPYVPESEFATLQPEVKDYEPKLALTSGSDGLDIIRKIVENGSRYLNSGGLLALEIGDGQAANVANLIAETGKYAPAEITKDYSGIERIITCHSRESGNPI